MPNVIVIGGPNGAGKTTAARAILPEVDRCIEFVNADEIARGLSPFNQDGVALQAGKIMLARLRELREIGADFSFETTMASRSFVPFLRDCKANGYHVSSHYFALDSPETAIQRVKQRVRLGGHGIPEEVIRRRFWAGGSNFLSLYIPLSDSWFWYNSLEPEPPVLAMQEGKGPLLVKDPALWQLFLTKMQHLR